MTFGGTGFSAAQFACAAVCLLDAEHHAVKYKEMQLLLGSIAAKGFTGSEDDAKLSGPTVLQSMVEANALSIRPYSNWALDIPLEAFEDQNAGKTTPQSTVQTVPQPPSSNKISTIVTAPSALNLYCMGQLRQQLDEVLEHLGQRQVGSWLENTLRNHVAHCFTWLNITVQLSIPCIGQKVGTLRHFEP